MTFLSTIFDKIALAVVTLLISLGFVATPAGQPIEEGPEVAEVETAPELTFNDLPEYDTFVEELSAIETEAEEGIQSPIVINVEVPSVSEEKISDTGFETAGSIFEEQIEEDNQMPEETLYTIIPQEGSPLEGREDITLAEMRDYVIQTNYDVLTFRQSMETATADELIEWLEANGFEVTHN